MNRRISKRVGSKRLTHLLCQSMGLVVAGLLVSGAAWADPLPEWGNDVIMGNSFSGIINDTNDRRVQRFVAPTSMTVDQFSIAFNSVTGSPTGEMALQLDDGGGNPDGTDIALGSFNPVQTTGSPMFTEAFNAPVALTAGQTYHLVLRSPNADASNWINWRGLGSGSALSTVNTMNPDGTPTTNYAQGFSSNGGSTWGFSTGQSTVWGLSDSGTSQGFGQAYSTAQVTSIGGDVWGGQKFVHTQETALLESISVRVRGSFSANLTDDLRLHVATVTSQGLNVDSELTITPGTSLYDGVLVASGTAPTTGVGELYTINIPEAMRPMLTQGDDYVILLETAHTGLVQMRYDQGSDDAGGFALAKDFNFQGLEGGFAVVTDAGAGVSGLPDDLQTLDFTSDTSGATFVRDLQFVLGLTPVPEPGTGMLVLVSAGALCFSRKRRSA